MDAAESPTGTFHVAVPDFGYWRRQIKCQETCPVHTDARGYVTAIVDGDPEWHLKRFRAPQATSPGSTMPPFKHLPEAELKALTVYVLSLREMPSALIHRSRHEPCGLAQQP